MCVIIHKPKGVCFDPEDITTAFERNRDGFGFMYYDSETKRIVASKKVFKTVQPILDIFAKQVDLEVVYHFRLKTHGKLNDSACHPFKVLDERKNGTGLYMMHNGVISGMTDHNSSESDTQAFVRLFMQPIFREKPSLINNRPQRLLIESVIGSGNKLVFMYGEGKVIKMNEKQGDQFKGCWVSNVYSFNKTHVRYNVSRGGQCDAGKPHTTMKDNNTVVTTTKGEDTTPPRGSASEGVLLGQEIKIGEKICLFHNTVAAYWATGTIHAIFTDTVIIKGINSKGTYDDLYFFLKDGEGTGRNPGYQVHPPSWQDENRAKKVKEVEAVKTSTEMTEDEKKDMIKQLNSTSKNVTSTGTSDKVVSLANEAEKKSKEITTLVVLADGETFDPKDNRYGGAWIKDTSAEYEGLTIKDVYDMDGTERWEFFSDLPIAAFSMLQDLVEAKVIEEDEMKNIRKEN